MTQVIESIEGIVGIPHPAIAVIPVPAGAGGLRHACCPGCNDGSGIFILMQFEDQSRADDLILENIGNGGVFYPLYPVFISLFKKILRG